MLKSVCVNQLQASSPSANSPANNSALLIAFLLHVVTWLNLIILCKMNIVITTWLACYIYEHYQLHTPELIQHPEQHCSQGPSRCSSWTFAEWPGLSLLWSPPSNRGSSKAWSTLIMSAWLLFLPQTVYCRQQVPLLVIIECTWCYRGTS